MSTKVINLFVYPSPDSNRPHGYIVSPIDPDEGIPAERRTYGSGFAYICPTVVPAGADVAATAFGEDFLWLGDTPLNLRYHPDKGIVTAWPAMWGTKPPEFPQRWIFAACKLWQIAPDKQIAPA